MSLISWAIDQAYIKRAINEVRREHDAWMRTASLGTTYWTLAPVHAHRPDLAWTYDIHGEYVFTKHITTPAGINALAGPHGTNSWELWYRHGPLTSKPQQTTASWNAQNAAGYAAEMARLDQAVFGELRRLYPASVKALVNA